MKNQKLMKKMQMFSLMQHDIFSAKYLYYKVSMVKRNLPNCLLMTFGTLGNSDTYDESQWHSHFLLQIPFPHEHEHL